VAILLNLAPSIELAVLARTSALVAGALVGSVVVPAANGFALPDAGVPVVVTTACSAADFSCVVAALVAWRLARRGRTGWLSSGAGIIAAAPLAIVVNAFRIAALTRVHQWLIPRLPEAYGPLFHLATGVAVFLPALIALDLLLKPHDHRTPASPR
jgi:exosortase/archaeosortase family protein